MIPKSSLYIHIPFCAKKCLYCSFTVCVAQQQHIDPYLKCLSKESEVYKGQNVQSIYIGGGTPTYLTGHQLGFLFSMIRKNFHVASSVEFTIEANPESLDKEKISIMKNAGVNRLSLGVQSFHNKYLNYLGRNHDADAALKAFELLREGGMKNISVDLMYLFPGQTFQELKEDVKQLTGFESEHVSLYTLTLEPNSRLFVQKEKLPSEDIQAQYYSYVKEALEKKGLKQYEVSNFAKRGRESLHNLNYWVGGNYIGLGVAAHSHKDGRRSWNNSFLKTYMKLILEKGLGEEGFEQLNPYERMKESFVFGLRMNRGVNIKNLQEKYAAVFIEQDSVMIKRLKDAGFLVREKGYLKATDKGRLILDELCAYLI
ncbi:MAG: radical SAM family heme chaperone HemW [Candidatus Omnitrophica bacterium]|nr:radical SAM family heme chaperone HemW [Candidatus Omnitrophota bacterium]